MKNQVNRIFKGGLPVLAALLMAFMYGCKQQHINYNTTSDVNMYTYIQQNPDRFSLFKSIIDKAGYASFLDTYGSYTLFLPNNEAVTSYLKAQNKTIETLDAAAAKNLISIALISDTLGTQTFTDGKLRTPTALGQYLITGATNVNGVSSITVNKQAKVLTGNIRVGNGLIHVIDNVLIPATLTLAQTIEANPKYAIFTAALKATGFYDTLNVPALTNVNLSRKYLTVIAHTDSTLKAAGFNDYNALKARYSTLNDPKNPKDSLWLYVAYHVWAELSYMSDIATTLSHKTLAPLEVTTSTLAGQTILLNNNTFNGVLEPGQQISRPNSDVSTTNGVLHNVLTNYNIKVRLPSPVYFDLGDQPEIRRTPGLYRAPGKSQAFKNGSLANVIVVGFGDAGKEITYGVQTATTTSDFYFNSDYLNIGARFRTGSNGINSVEFVTPVIVKGRYKVWVDYRRSGNNQLIPVSFDGQALPNAFNTNDGLNANENDAQSESRGFKNYTESPKGTSTTAAYNSHTSRLVGVIDVTTTDHHRIKFTATANQNSAVALTLDAVEFRPIDMNQLRPLLGKDGSLIP